MPFEGIFAFFSQDFLGFPARKARQIAKRKGKEIGKTKKKHGKGDQGKFGGVQSGFFKERKSAINLSNLANFCPSLAPGHLFMLGRSAVPKFIYVRTAAGPENTSNTGENPNINNLT